MSIDERLWWTCAVLAALWAGSLIQAAKKTGPTTCALSLPDGRILTSNDYREDGSMTHCTYAVTYPRKCK